jgi:DNA-binding NtrC family response regulator
MIRRSRGGAGGRFTEGGMAGRILIVDDDPVQRRQLEEAIRQQGHSCESVGGGEAALARLARADAPAISAMILDLVMPDLDGMAVLERLERFSISVPVIVQAANGGADVAISAMRAGAFDFLVKPASPERIRVSLANALRIGALENEVGRMRRSRTGTLGFGDVIMRAPIMERVTSLSERAARTATPVLLEGERGTGKELVARAIHGSGPRRTKPFVTVNCAAIRECDIDTVLFGCAPGGMNSQRSRGKYAEAHSGTLFLNQIGALPNAAQVKLLGLMGDCEAASPGNDCRRRQDVRLIATTNRRLVDLVSQGSFREDLFHRLNVLPIWLPPLRERRSDIPELARRMLTRLAAEEGRPGVLEISDTAMALLAAFEWPGNVRQLENVLFRAVALSEGGELTPRDFPHLATELDTISARPGASGEVGAEIAVADQRQSYGEATPPPRTIADRLWAARYGVARLLDERGELRPIDALEAEVIRFAVGHYRGQMSEVARRLGIGRSTLYRKLKDYGIASGEVTVP